MKKFLFLIFVSLFGVTGFIATASAAHKVDICHLNSANDILLLGGLGEVAFGREISVSGKSADKHIANHGDSEDYFELTPDFRDFIEGAFLVTLPNADCYFFNFDF